MTDQATLPTNVQDEGSHPTHVSADEYLEKYAHDFYEWENGALIKMAPVRLRHFALSTYLLDLIQCYFVFKPIGMVVAAPFLMRVDSADVKREPDLQVILNDNPGELTETAMLGPADICIEIVSPESEERDFVKKRSEYERAGVKEYWLLDYLHKGSHFYRLNEQGIYILQSPDADGNYQTPLLPDEAGIPTLWEDPLPNYEVIGEMVKAMLGIGSGV